MMRSCIADIVDVCSPASQPSELHSTYQEGSSSSEPAEPLPPRGKPPVEVDDRFFFHCRLHQLRCQAVHYIRTTSPRLQLCIEVSLLVSALLMLSGLVILHSHFAPSPVSPHTSTPESEVLTQALARRVNGTSLLRFDMFASSSMVCEEVFPAMQSLCNWAYPQTLRCEFAREKALLELPPVWREQLFSQKHPEVLHVQAQLKDSEVSGFFWYLISKVPFLSISVMRQRILATILWGPLRKEARHQQSVDADLTGPFGGLFGAVDGPGTVPWGQQVRPAMNVSVSVSNSSAAKPIVSKTEESQERKIPRASPVEIAPLPPSAFGFVSCSGADPASLQPLMRVAELLQHRSEWWLFKSVWAMGVTFLTLLTSVAAAFLVRCGAFCLFRLRASFCACAEARIGGPHWLELLEASVFAVMPVGIILMARRIAGDLAGDATLVLLCFICGELSAAWLLKTEESRFLFPWAVIPIYIADIYYVVLQPFAFTGFSHSVLILYQLFVLAFLLSHFEATSCLPLACPDRLTTEVRARPNDRRHGNETSGPMSRPMQQLLLEQGLLLLGDDHSFESAAVMSAIISRAIPAPGYCGPCRPRPGEPYTAEMLAAMDAEYLGGGAASELLVEHGQAGSVRCLALMAHLITRMLPLSKSCQHGPHHDHSNSHGPGARHGHTPSHSHDSSAAVSQPQGSPRVVHRHAAGRHDASAQ
eukprot:gnl/MRDRNA2_/MRDRNA2_14528_c0_seq1.p1 gnl/MRDRNA2_/MRDRNA2_14528_c0~~gnl/MRDRNA2_/MRDRNA2_14528_c0_seq1.p1  ORF type:complete len:702 (+),score=92.44 gnl/MRDRNA2_/MRDRNA2_14528_c0_seq1:122-2227(+)